MYLVSVEKLLITSLTVVLILSTCYSHDFKKQGNIPDLKAGNIIFWGNHGSAIPSMNNDLLYEVSMIGKKIFDWYTRPPKWTIENSHPYLCFTGEDENGKELRKPKSDESQYWNYFLKIVAFLKKRLLKKFSNC